MTYPCESLTKMADQISSNKESSASQTQLDGLVVNIELTLISIIQGVAFSFLADNSRGVLVNRQLTFGPMPSPDC